MTQFQIVCADHPTLAIQAGAGVGQGVTLQPRDAQHPYQCWEIALQKAQDAWFGLALVNTVAGQARALAANGGDTALVMQDFHFISALDDAWTLTAQGEQRFCIALARSAAWRLNAHRATFQVGDSVDLAQSDAVPSSQWQFIPLDGG